jgi:hypothetical protein
MNPLTPPNARPACASPTADETGEAMLRAAISLTLEAAPRERADLFERLTGDIAALTTAPGTSLRPWRRTVHTGVDGSRIFCGGVGLSVVIDPEGRLWRGRTYEDFATTYRLTDSSCEVETMEPRYAQMREYVRSGPPGESAGADPVSSG